MAQTLWAVRQRPLITAGLARVRLTSPAPGPLGSRSEPHPGPALERMAPAHVPCAGNAAVREFHHRLRPDDDDVFGPAVLDLYTHGGQRPHRDPGPLRHQHVPGNLSRWSRSGAAVLLAVVYWTAALVIVLGFRSREATQNCGGDAKGGSETRFTHLAPFEVPGANPEFLPSMAATFWRIS
jgi:hypothetical protein